MRATLAWAGRAAVLLALVPPGVVSAQAPFLANGEDAVLFGGVYSHDAGQDGRDSLGAGVGFTVASWAQFELSIARVGGEQQTNYGLGVEAYPLRPLNRGSVEPFLGLGWSHAAIFPEQMRMPGLVAPDPIELDIYPLTAGLSARLDINPNVGGALQVALLQVAGDRGPGRPDRSGWLISLGLRYQVSARRALVAVPAFSRVYGREIGSVLFGIQFGRS